MKSPVLFKNSAAPHLFFDEIDMVSTGCSYSMPFAVYGKKEMLKIIGGVGVPL
jgi:hypothetical protein